MTCVICMNLCFYKYKYCKKLYKTNAFPTCFQVMKTQSSYIKHKKSLKFTTLYRSLRQSGAFAISILSVCGRRPRILGCGPVDVAALEGPLWSLSIATGAADICSF